MINDLPQIAQISQMLMGGEMWFPREWWARWRRIFGAARLVGGGGPWFGGREFDEDAAAVVVEEAGGVFAVAGVAAVGFGGELPAAEDVLGAALFDDELGGEAGLAAVGAGEDDAAAFAFAGGNAAGSAFAELEEEEDEVDEHGAPGWNEELGIEN